MEKGFEYFQTLYPNEVTDSSFTPPKAIEDESDSIDDVEYPHIQDIMMKDDVTIGAPIFNRAHKTNAMKIYEEKRNVNDVINERKMLSHENLKTSQQLEDAEKSMKSNHYDEEAFQSLTYMIMQLETDKKNQVSFLFKTP